MAQEKYPASCPWDLGPDQSMASNPYWLLLNGAETVRFSKEL